MQKISEIIPTMPGIMPVQRTAEEQERYNLDYWEKCRQGDKISYRPKQTTKLLPWGKDKLPDFARFRLAVRFDNQKYAYYPSYDHQYIFKDRKKDQIYDEQIGLEKLYTLANTEKRYWNWVAISIFVNITDKWANAQMKIYNYRLITWEPHKCSGHLLKLEYYNGRLDLPYMQMQVAQSNIKGYSTAEERAPWQASIDKYSKSK